MSEELKPTAWEAYWPGAGSVDSVTRTTHSERVAAQWRADGAEITPLVALTRLASIEEERDRLREALKPFARIAEVIGDKPRHGMDDFLHGWQYVEGEAVLRLSDCVRARAALNASPSPAKPDTVPPTETEF